MRMRWGLLRSCWLVAHHTESLNIGASLFLFTLDRPPTSILENGGVVKNSSEKGWRTESSQPNEMEPEMEPKIELYVARAAIYVREEATSQCGSVPAG